MSLVSNLYPYTDFHEMNLDWILGEICKLHKDMNEFEVINQIKWKGTWNISKQYPIWSIVDNGNGFGYISIKDVPAGIELTNEDYWRLTSNYSVLYADMQNRIINLENNYNILDNKIGNVESKLDIEYFRNKKIYIIGDSTSDNTTYPPNWTVYFTNKVGAVNADVHNIAVNGWSWIGWNENLDNIPTDGNIYIIMLGINDFQAQFNMVATGATQPVSLQSAINNVIRKCLGDDNDVYVISPLKCFLPSTATYSGCVNMYRRFIEQLAQYHGCHVISGYNIPVLNPANKDIYTDGVHPKQNYAPILANYIYESIISGVSSFSPDTSYQIYKNAEDFLIRPQNGSIVINEFTSNFTAFLELNVLSIPLQSGINSIIDLKTGGNGIFNDPALRMTTPINEYTNTPVEMYVENGILKINSPSQQTISIHSRLLLKFRYDVVLM